MTATMRTAVLFLMLGIAGCALLKGDAFGTRFMPAASSGIDLPGANANGKHAVVYRSPSDYEVYRRSDDASGRTEAILMVANHNQTILEFSPFRLKSWVSGFAFNQSARRLAWQHEHLLRSHGRVIRFARFQRWSADAAGPRHCVAFMRNWAVRPDDPLLRDSKAWFGYHCAPTGAAMSATEVRQYLSGIRTATSNLKRVYYGDHIPNVPRALAYARGTRKADWGYPDFPLRRARHYTVDNGADRDFR